MTNHIADRRNKSRRGVGVIIGGVIVFGIILSTVLLFFLSIINNEKAKTGFEILAAQANQDKAAEDLTAFRDQALITDPPGYPAGVYINAFVSNEGSLPAIVSHSALYCVSPSGCPSPNDPDLDPSAFTLNAKDSASRPVGPVSNGLSYSADFITERGNIVSAGTCDVDLAAQICTNDPGTGGIPDFSLSAIPSTVVMEAGNPGSSVIRATSLNGFSSAVTLDASNAGVGIGSSFGANPITPPAGSSATSTLSITTAPTTTPGTYTMIITGTSGSITHTTGISITVLEEGTCVECAVTEGIIQGTGSVQLDFKSFGAIFPTLQDRDTISQKGWQVSASKVPGYPGFTLKESLPTILVERMRNFDPSGQAMVLGRSTSLVSQLAGTTGNNPSANHICTRSGDSAVAYNGNQILPYTTPTSDPDAGMQTVYFCSITQGGTGAWSPSINWGNTTPVFMILRSTFQNTILDYGQTVPYQSFVPSRAFNDWYVCLTTSDLLISVANNCENPTAAAAKTIYKHRGAPGETVYIHFNNNNIGSGAGTPPYSLEWVYSDGSSKTLSYVNTGNGNLQIIVPDTMADNVTPIVQNAPYILKVSDGSVHDQGPRTMFMTFQVT